MTIPLIPTTSAVDVVPLGDFYAHDVPGGYADEGDGWLVLQRPGEVLYPRCCCSPRQEPVCAIDGSLGTVHVHRAWDGREATEREQ